MKTNASRMAEWTTLAAVITVTGCTTPHVPSPVDTVAAAAVRAPEGTPESPAPPSASWGALVGNAALDQWIGKAIAQHPALKTARAGTEVARSRVHAARAARRPALDVELDLRAGEHGGTAYDADSDVARSALKAQGSWELDPFGRIRAAVGAARYAQVAVDYECRDLELAIASEVATRYVAALVQFDRLAIRKRALAAHADIERYYGSRLGAGLTKQQTLEQSKAARLEAKRAQIAAAKHLAILHEEWKALIPANDVPELSSLDRAPLPPVPEPPNQDRLHAYAVNRPDVTAVNALWQSAQRRTAAAARGRLPSVAAVASAEGSGPSPVEEPEEWMAWAGVRVTLPMLSPDTTAQIAVQRAVTDRAAAELHDAVRLALLDVRRAYVLRMHAEREWHTARTRAAEMKAALASAERQREQGLLSIPDVARARIAWLAADEKARALHARALQHHISLIRACGGPDRKKSVE